MTTPLDSDSILVFPSVDELVQAATDYVLDVADQAIQERGRFLLALSGGSTPRRLHQSLIEAAGRRNVDWSKWQFFQGDERVVPSTDERSNFHMAEESLLSKIPVDQSQIHRVPTELGDPEKVADAYEQELRSFFGDTGMPQFDLILLGMGSDGHTASLFPRTPKLHESQRLLIATPPGVLPPPVDRVTFTFPVINAARHVVFLATGGDKQAAFDAVRHRTPLPGSPEVPSAMVRPADGELRWFVDQAVAGGES